MKNEMTKTSIQQPRELWNKVRSDAITQGKKTDEVLTEILKQYYANKALADAVKE